MVNENARLAQPAEVYARQDLVRFLIRSAKRERYDYPDGKRVRVRLGLCHKTAETTLYSSSHSRKPPKTPKTRKALSLA
jgi:hypothetical protein